VGFVVAAARQVSDSIFIRAQSYCEGCAQSDPMRLPKSDLKTTQRHFMALVNAGLRSFLKFGSGELAKLFLIG
jgi:hypothetical protein